MASDAASRANGFLGDRRLRIALWIAVVEGLLVVLSVIPWWAVLIVAVFAVAYWGLIGRNFKSPKIRQASWVFATSQVLVLLVPVLFFFFKAFAYIMVVILVLAALVFLFAEREPA
jgi:hypothetical protein